MSDPRPSRAGGGRIALIVHGGAGDIREELRPAHLAGLEKALDAGWSLLLAGSGAVDAVEAAVQVLEDDPVFNAGVGSVLRLDASVALDASLMDGFGRRAGAVAGVSRVRHPISLARLVLEKTPHVFLIGEGAEALAREAGLELCDPAFFVTEKELQRLERIRARRETGKAMGTVGAVARDRRGHIAAGTSTGGAPGCLPGRVGDTPVVGAGTFADDRSGGASATGTGENILRVTLTREVVRRLGEGVEPQAAAEWAVEYLRAETGGACGVICLDAAGEPGAAFNTRWMGSLSRTLTPPTRPGAGRAPASPAASSRRKRPRR